MKEILHEEEDLSEIVQQLFLSLLFTSWVSYRWRRYCRRRRNSLRLCVSTVFEVAVHQLSFLQVKEILQEEEDLSEIVQQLFLLCLCVFEPAVLQSFCYRWSRSCRRRRTSLRLCSNCFWVCCSSNFVCYRWRRSCRRRRTCLRLCSNCLWCCCSLAEFLTGEGDPTGGGGISETVQQLFLRLLFFSWYSYRWRRSCRRRRTSLRLCSNCLWWCCCSSAEFLTGEGDPAGGGGPLWDCAATVFQVAVL